MREATNEDVALVRHLLPALADPTIFQDTKDAIRDWIDHIDFPTAPEAKILINPSLISTIFHHEKK